MYKIDVNKYSLLIPNNYQEYVTMIFSKNTDPIYVREIRDKLKLYVCSNSKN